LQKKKQLFIVCFLTVFLYIGLFSSNAEADTLYGLAGGSMQVSYKARKISDNGGSDSGFIFSSDMLFEYGKQNKLRFYFDTDLIQTNKDTGIRSTDIHNTYNSGIRPYFYQLFGEYTARNIIRSIKAGRQYISGIFSAHLDGLSSSIDLFTPAINVSLYQGSHVELFETDAGKSEVSGNRLKLSTPFRTVLIFEEQSLKQEKDPSESGISGVWTQRGLSVIKQFDAGMISITGQYHEGEFKSIEYKASVFEKTSFDLSILYYRQFKEVSQMPSFTIPALFTGELSPVKPYERFVVNLNKSFSGDTRILSAGLERRSLILQEDESDFNHSYNHAYTALTFTSHQGSSYTIHGDIWQETGGLDNKILTGGAEYQYSNPQYIRFRLGTFYSLYKYDYYSDLDEKNDVYTVFTEIKHLFPGGFYIKERYDLDIYDVYEHRLSMSAGVNF